MRIIRISSDSGSDDDVPLKVLKNGHPENPNSYASLCRHSFEACEFCDTIFKNRYSRLIHNVRHIIIPLLNQTVVQCKICLHHFTSQEELRRHAVTKHLNSTIYINLTKTEPTYFGSQNAIERAVPSDKLEIQPFSRPNNRVEILENCSEKSEHSNVSIKNRLIFEDDLIISDCDQLLNDLTTDCKVNLEMFETPWLKKEYSEKSVHYDELVKPGVYRCKKCGKGFPIRYDAIIHETSHLSFKNIKISHCVICDEYIEGDIIKLKRHYLNYHKEKYKKQTDNECVTYKKNNVSMHEGNEREDKQFVTKTLSLCEFCFSFYKNKSYVIFESVKTISELGKRYKCQQCRSRFFEIYLVTRRLQKRHFRCRKNKIKSNEDRLKMITNRFKMLKH